MSHPVSPPCLTVVVTVNHNLANCISVMTEPRASSRVLAHLHDMLVPRRDDLADGTYTMTYTVENGCVVEGGDQASGATLKRMLSEDLSDLTTELADMLASLSTTDGMVEALAGVYVSAIIEVSTHKPGFELKPGFVDVVVGCPGCGFVDFTDAKTLEALRRFAAETSEMDEAARAELAQRIEGLERQGLPQVRELTSFLEGVSCKAPFAGFANEKRASQCRDVAPLVEARVVEILGQIVERGASRIASLGEQLAHWG